MSDVRGVRDALAVLNEYVKGAVDWRDVAEGWKAACYKAQNETLAAAKERDSAKRGLESERFVNAAQVRKLTEERDSARLLLKDAEARAVAAEVRAEEVRAKAKDQELKEVYDLRENLVQTCLRAGQAESRLTAMRDERDTATAALKSMTDQYREAAAEIERLKAEVGRVTRERDAALAGQRGGSWSGPARIVISVDGCGQCGFPTVSCLCPCWGVE